MLLRAGLLRLTALLPRRSANIFKPAATAPIKSPPLRPSCRECLREPCRHGSYSPTATSVWEPLNISTGKWWCLRESFIRCAATARWRLGGTYSRYRLRVSAAFSPIRPFQAGMTAGPIDFIWAAILIVEPEIDFIACARVAVFE